MLHMAMEALALFHQMQERKLQADHVVTSASTNSCEKGVQFCAALGLIPQMLAKCVVPPVVNYCSAMGAWLYHQDRCGMTALHYTVFGAVTSCDQKWLEKRASKRACNLQLERIPASM